MLTASGIIVMKDELNQNSYIQRTIHILYMKKNDRNKTPQEPKTRIMKKKRKQKEMTLSKTITSTHISNIRIYQMLTRRQVVCLKSHLKFRKLQ